MLALPFTSSQYPKRTMLELYYNFFYEFSEIDKYEEIERHTNSLYPALAENILSDCLQKEKPEVSEFFVVRIAMTIVLVTCAVTVLRAHAVNSTRNMAKEYQVVSKRCLMHRTYVYLSRLVVVMKLNRTSIKVSCK